MAKPNVLYVVWDDAGIATWDAFGGLIDTPHLSWLAARGLRYTQWHTTALSAPTRSCLLTGRNGGPGGTARAGRGGSGRLGPGAASPPAPATLAQILAENGYRTYCVGKWHLRPEQTLSMAQSRETWPLRHGFDRYYGFLGDAASHWDPALIYDSRHVDPPYLPAEGYHLSADLVSMAVEFIRDGTQAAPGVPWMCYLSFGAAGGPHNAPREWADKYRGMFAAGYDRYREIALGNMQRLGVIPPGTDLAAAGPGPAGAAEARQQARPWDALSEAEQRLSSRDAESYAGLCSYTDHQVGRLLSYLERSGQLDDTVVVACSANAGSPAGWEGAFSTPYDALRQSALGGSAASPLIISSAREMRGLAGGVRDQYHHAVDIVPTILDCAAVDPPQIVQGHRPAPLHGVSMRYTFMAPDAPSTRRTQLYDMPGGRSIYHDGWKAVAAGTTIVAASTVAAQRGGAGGWELYDVAGDRTETAEVSGRYPRKAAELAALWGTQADGEASPVPVHQEPAPLASAG